MTKDEVGDVHNILIPDSMKVEATKRIPIEGEASKSLPQPNKTRKSTVEIVESLATLEHSVGRRTMTRFPSPSSKRTRCCNGWPR